MHGVRRMCQKLRLRSHNGKCWCGLRSRDHKRHDYRRRAFLRVRGYSKCLLLISKAESPPLFFFPFWVDMFYNPMIEFFSGWKSRTKNKKFKIGKRAEHKKTLHPFKNK